MWLKILLICVRKLPGDARVGPKNIFEVAGAGVPGARNGAAICLALPYQRNDCWYWDQVIVSGGEE